MQRPGRLLRIFLMLTLASGVLVVPVTGEASPATDVAALAPYIAVLPVASGLQQPVLVFDNALKIPFRQTDLLGELTSAGSTWGS